MYFKISEDELITLLKNNHMLKALQQAGVDNWNCGPLRQQLADL